MGSDVTTVPGTTRAPTSRAAAYSSPEVTMPRRPVALLAGFASAVLAFALLSATPATAKRVSQGYPMPDKGTVTIRGHGYGHGHGMSQHGAQGAALEGLTWRQIVRFYYPGTRITDGRGMVEVLISGDTTRDVLVKAREGLVVRDLQTRQRWVLPDNGAKRWRLGVTRKGRTAVYYRTDRWYRWRQLDGEGAFAADGKPIRLYLAGTSRLYRGMLKALRPTPGSNDRDTVNRISLDNYIKGVIPAEMPASWEPHAVRAQAVAARTYASYEKAHQRADHYQICDTTACQVYGGYSAEHPLSNAAVKATRGRILTVSGEPAFTQFSASSGGWTSANQFDYLPAQEDPYDDWSGNTSHAWSVSVDVSRIERRWPGIGNLERIRVTERDGNGEWQGRVRTLVLVGSKKRVTVSGDTFRFALGLKSTWFSFDAPRARTRLGGR